MKKLTIPFSGITRNTDDAVCKDGECMELINARVRNGSLQPIGRPTVHKNIPLPLRKVYYHSNGGYTNLIGLTTSRQLFWVESNNILIHTFTEDVISIASIGNTLIVSLAENKFYFLFKENKYLLLGDQIPYPEINFKLKATDKPAAEKLNNYADITISGGQYANVGFNGFDEQRIKEFTNSVHGTLLKLIDKQRDQNAFIYPVIIRYVIRLYDNSYILHSPPMFLNFPEEPISVYGFSGDWQDATHLTGIRYNASIKHFGLYYEFLNSPVFGNWSDLILGIEVFVCRGIEQIDFNEDIKGFDCTAQNGAVGFDLNWKTGSQLKDEMEDVSQFFNLSSFSSAQVYTNGILELPQKIFENLELRERLPDDDFSHNKFGGNMFIYNSRLHVFDLKTKLYEGFPLNNWILRDGRYYNTNLVGVQILSGEVRVFLNAESGNKCVRYTFGNIGTVTGLQPFLSYPDPRAYWIEIYFKIDESANPYRRFRTPLKQHAFLNLAYYNKGTLALSWGDFEIKDKILPIGDLTDIDYSPNKLKVSQVNNPFYFPNKNTYQPCTSKITALASNTQAVSSGQFGHYPLYVFSEGGIYAMQIGSGDVLYSNTTPVSRDVLLSRDAVCGTGSSLVFLSKQGLMMLSGSQTQVISGAMHGFTSRALQSDPTIRKALELADLDHAVSTIDFFDYIKGSSLGYNYGDNEVILSNPTQQYSYVVSLDSLDWHKVSRKFALFPNSYPESLALEIVGDSVVLWDLLNKSRSSANIAVVTRPIKLGSLTHKRIMQASMRGVMYESNDLLGINSRLIEYFRNTLNLYPKCAFYIMASNDAVNFKVVSGREHFTDIRDLILKMNKLPAFKYYMFIVIGGFMSEVIINHIELLADEAFGNRLR